MLHNTLEFAEKSLISQIHVESSQLDQGYRLLTLFTKRSQTMPQKPR